MFNENNNRKMAKEPKLKWGDGAEYLTGIGVVGYTSLKDVFMKKPRAGACYRYIKLKDIADEEN